MKLTILVDNQTFGGLHAQWGFSCLIEDADATILFDTGMAGELWLENARALNLPVEKVDWVVLSHGHYDHSGSLKEAAAVADRPRLVAHPQVIAPKYNRKGIYDGIASSRQQLAEMFSLHFSRDPLWLTDRIVFLGEIPRLTSFEGKDPRGCGEDREWMPDDSALACVTENGVAIVTGCSHAGICNIVAQARQVCGNQQIVDIVGGLHLTERIPPKQLAQTVDYLRKAAPTALHACHCTGLRARAALLPLGLADAGVGTVLEYH